MDRGIYDADVILVLGGETSYIIVVLVTSGWVKWRERMLDDIYIYAFHALCDRSQISLGK